MKTVLLHGLGQTAQDWKEVVQQLSISDVDCPELFSSAEDEISYSQILGDLEQRYSEVKEPLRICGLSLGALLAIDFAIRHEEKVASLVLIGAQYKVPSLLIDFQNLIFRCMPDKAFESMGLSKSSTIKLAHSMRSLDFTSQLNNIRCPVTILCGKKDAANPETVRCGYALNSHPAVLDGFIDLVCEEQQRSRTQREKLEPSRPSVRDKLKQELPAHKSAAPKKREPER